MFVGFCISSLASSISPGSLWAATDDPVRLYLHGLLEERFGRPESALEEYERAVALDPSAVPLHEALSELAIKVSQTDRALSEAQTVVRLRKNDAPSFILLGRVYLARGELDLAAQSFEKALQAEPENNEALLYAAHIRAQTHPTEALGFYERYLQSNPFSTEALGRIGALQERLGNKQAAEGTYLKALEADSSDYGSQLALARLYEVRGDTSSAVAAYENCHSINPGEVALVLKLGELYYRAGDLASAEDAFQEAASLAPDDLSIHFWLGLVAEERRDWDLACRHMELVSRQSRDPGVFVRLAYYQSQAGRSREAVKVLRRLVKSHPKTPDFWHYLGLAYEDVDKHHRAIDAFERELVLDNTRAEGHFRLGVIWDTLKRFDRAEEPLLKAVGLEPDNPTFLNYLGYSWADRGLKLDAALDATQRAAALDPDNGAYRDSLGWAYYKRGQLQEAAGHLAQAAARIDDPIVWGHYGDVLARQGKTEEALLSYLSGLNRAPDNGDLLSRVEQTAPPVVLARAGARFTLPKSLAGSVRFQGKADGAGFQGGGVFHYARPGLFRVELAGPFMGPPLLVVKNPRGLFVPKTLEKNRWAVEEWLGPLSLCLSGEAFRVFTGAASRPQGGRLVYETTEGTLAVDAKRGEPLELFIKKLAVKVLFLDYRSTGGYRLPGRIVFAGADGRAALVLDVSRLKSDVLLDAALFDTPPDEKEPAHNR